MLLGYPTITEEVMPKYRFSCEHCTREWWQWLGMNDPSPEICPHCNGAKPKKIPTTFSLKDIGNSSRDVGDTVEEAIMESAIELEKEKRKIKSEIYDDI